MALLHLVAEWAKAGRHGYRAEFSNSNDRVASCDGGPAKLPQPVWLDGVATREDLDARGGPAPIVVLTVDHGLRAQAADEAQLVANHAAKLGLPHQIIESDEAPPETGVQDWARRIRRRLILELLQAEEMRYRDLRVEEAGRIPRLVVMAHHLDDQAETVLMRLARGSGLVGLGGMREWDYLSEEASAEAGHENVVPLMRPFLCVPKSRLVATLRHEGIEFIEDPSNADERFERVRIRNALTGLNAIGLTAEAIGRSARRLREAEESLASFEDAWQAEIVEQHGGLLGEVEFAQVMSKGRFAAIRLLQTLLENYGGRARAAELAQVELLFDRMMDGEFSGATLGGCRVQMDGDCFDGGRLRIFREGNGEGLEAVRLGTGQSVEWDGRFQVTSDDAAPGDVEVRALGGAGWARLKREVDGLDELKLKAAAMATMTAIWRGEEILSVPYLDRLLAAPEVLSKAARAWAKWRPAEAGLFKAEFLAAGDVMAC
ncbi:MAG: tRNA lysidine(34) synthetase TilS [Alphaproteobacteria bacterium]|nr:tRNA lysidine(34) synthetase TilS [Alphaproteobacteria bacterium]